VSSQSDASAVVGCGPADAVVMHRRASGPGRSGRALDLPARTQARAAKKSCSAARTLA
jgi:hypothetical protein